MTDIEIEQLRALCRNLDALRNVAASGNHPSEPMAGTVSSLSQTIADMVSIALDALQRERGEVERLRAALERFADPSCWVPLDESEMDSRGWLPDERGDVVWNGLESPVGAAIEALEGAES